MLEKINREDLHSHFLDMKFLSSVNNLGFVLDERLDMEEQNGSTSCARSEASANTVSKQHP